MNALARLYRHPLALLTDLYQVTMAYGYWRSGLAEREAVFHLSFRRLPFGGGYAVAAGLESALEYLRDYALGEEDLAYLAGLCGRDGQPLFEAGFLEFLGQTQLRCDVDAIPEGSPVFPHEPLLRVRGPLYQCQLLETPLLNTINFQTLIATKAARICSAAGDDDVLEFGLRRAQGVDGALAASRAAYLGGCAATSNVLAGKLHGIPVRGTHAHSWVMAFPDEEASFRAYAAAMPNNCVFLVDTYDTLRGVRRAAEVARELRAGGHELVGVRLDSGDLAQLSLGARELLDEAGFPDAHIVASNDLDEELISSLKLQGAAIDTWGVGTKLVTAYDQPALGGVYKLCALRQEDGSWDYKIKLSEQHIKVNIPGVLQVRRYKQSGCLSADMIYDEELGLSEQGVMLDPTAAQPELSISPRDQGEDLLVPVLRGGEQVYTPPPLAEARARCAAELASLPSGVLRFANPARYRVGLERRLCERKRDLIRASLPEEARAGSKQR